MTPPPKHVAPWLVVASKPCEDCQRRLTVRRERFCRHCRESRIWKMEKAGYLAPIDRRQHVFAGPNPHARHFDDDPGPCRENAIRAMEDARCRVDDPPTSG